MEPMKHSQQDIKETHLKLMLSLIHQVDGISRADIKKLTNLSATTVSALVEELMDEGLVVETGMKTSTTSGRKAISLSINKNGGHLGAVGISGHHFCLRIFDLHLEEIYSVKVRYDTTLPLSYTLCAFLKEHLCVQDYGRLLGLAVGIPAIVNRDNQIVSSTIVNVTADDDVYGSLCTAFPNAKVLLCNNSWLMAYAEKEFGELECKSLISIDISDGVGAAAIVDGVPFNGSAGMACEFGHISVDMNGKPCRCGSRGCLETMISVPAILEGAGSIAQKEITLEMLSPCAVQTPELEQYMDDICTALAFGINNLLNIFDPDAVVLCGDILALGEDFIRLVRKKLSDISLAGRTVSLTASTLGSNAEFKGGAKFVFDSLLR